MGVNVFEIELADQSKIYMQGNDDEFYKIIKIDVKKFLEKINVDSRCCDVLTSKISPYHQNKYRHAEMAFANSINKPVPLAGSKLYPRR